MEHRQLTLAEPFSHHFELECLALAEVYLNQRRGQDAVTLLDGLRPQSLQRGRMDAVLKIDILRAAALYQLGEQSEALPALESAIALAEPEGYLRPFAEQAPWISHLLLMLQRSRNARVRAYVPTVLQACGMEPTSDSAAQSVPVDEEEYLTPREAEILHLLAQGYTNQQIAESTFVSLNTVKTHIKHIYAKLGVNDRTQAILWAKEHLDED
jgi:LuxR family maltose regulon positive regulatory protein